MILPVSCPTPPVRYIFRRRCPPPNNIKKALEEALHVTAGSGTAGAGSGNPAYVLSRLRALCDDDFMSAFEYAGGGG